MNTNRGELFDNAWLSYSSRAAATQTNLTTGMSAFEENFTTSKGYLILVGTVESNTSVSDKPVARYQRTKKKTSRSVSSASSVRSCTTCASPNAASQRMSSHIWLGKER